MTELLVILVVGIAVIAAATVFGPRLGIAAPLVLVAIGVAASFLPVFETVHIDPEWILQGVLPPLLYSAAVSMPSMNFRREFGAISGLSVLLVVASSLILGVFFMLVLPDLGFGWGVALGAIISPTDAVATSIVKGTSVSRRVVAMLDGESLLNDATAIVLLRTAIVAAGASFSFWGALGTFAYSVAVAVVIGLVVGNLNLVIRKRIKDPTVNTLISFAVPFIAAVPAGLLNASGLVAAVAAGIVTGYRAPRDLAPQSRLSDTSNWRTVELVLEGAVFLTMGLQLKTIVTGAGVDVGPAILIAAGALLLTIAIRAAYVVPLLGVLSWQARRSLRLQPRVAEMKEQIKTDEGKQQVFRERNPRGGREVSERQLNQFARRVTQAVADIEYFLREPLGWREGTAVVWAGMRGAVTVAAAQTLPLGELTPQRPVLVLIAFAVALMSLVLQGATIGPLLRRITKPVDPDEAYERTKEERTRIFELLKTSAESIPQPDDPHDRSREGFETQKRYRLAVIAAQRTALLDARDNGTFDAEILEIALANLDASQIDMEMRGRLA